MASPTTRQSSRNTGAPGLNKIPEKLFYKVGEVSSIAGVEPYVLRYWESEFPFLSPRKSSSGQRLYVKKDVELILQIRKLLHEERYTIEGVRKKFSRPSLKVVNSGDGGTDPELRMRISEIKRRLKSLIRQI